MTVQILKGDCRDVLRTLPAESVHCVVTSPPYWGLRDYGMAAAIGLEESFDQWLESMASVFDEVRRVLRSDGTCWVNCGDSYASKGGAGWQGKNGQRADRRFTAPNFIGNSAEASDTKAKDLIGQPWRLAFALRDRGWWLRRDIIWFKPNAMPESAEDRPHTDHEYIFMFSKSARYSYDAEAIKELASENTHSRVSIKKPDGWDTGAGGHGSFHRNGREKGKTIRLPGVTPKSAQEDSNVRAKGSFHATTTSVLETRHKRSVWAVPTSPFKEAHFATFPPALIEPCIKAGCPAGGVVLDPFGGAGTTGMVADRLGRNAILIEINPEYAALAERRIKGDAGMFASVHS